MARDHREDGFQLAVGVHQFLPTFEPGAIGEDALKVQRVLHEAGYESEIFAEYIRPPFEDKAYVHTDYGHRIAGDANDVLIYHMALGSNVADWLESRHETLMLRHHNITPVEFYSPWPDANTYGMAWGRHQLRELTTRTAIGCGVSEFNRRELEALHFARTEVTPLVLDFSQFDHDTDPRLIEKLDVVSGTKWLFVGWIAPHKCQHDIIRAFSLYKKLYDSNAHLYLVGRVGLESYRVACEKLVVELGLKDAVTFTGRVSDAELGSYYRSSDVLVSMSEHEGVGIPLLEAMYNRLPVVAYASSAVPETIGDSGILLHRKRPAIVAAAVHRVTTDELLKEQLLARGIKRLSRFDIELAKQRLLDAVAQVL